MVHHITKILFFEEFKKWLDHQPYENERSRDSIISRLNKLNERLLVKIFTGSLVTDKKTGQTSGATVWDIIDKIFKDPNGPKVTFLEDLLQAILTNINEAKDKIAKENNIAVGTVENYASAFCTYMAFLLENARKISNHRLGALTPDEIATIKNITGDIIKLTQNQLITIFASRLNTQDRCTGDKVFLPIALIAKILKIVDNNNIRSYKNMLQWAKEEAKRVVIHTENEVLKVSEIDELTIDTTTGIVRITPHNSSDIFQVFNPPLNNSAPKTPMIIYRISQTDIDHDEDIDTVLRKLNTSLNGLQQLTSWILKAQRQLNIDSLNSKNIDDVYNQIMSWPNISSLITDQLVTDIHSDLKAIAKMYGLQLSDNRWNRSLKKQNKQS